MDHVEDGSGIILQSSRQDLESLTSTDSSLASLDHDQSLLLHLDQDQSLLLHTESVQRPGFVDNPKEDLKCYICEEVLVNPVQSVCGHRFCRTCAVKTFSNDEPVKCPVNEDDCSDIILNKLNKDRSARRELQNLEVYCTHEDCTETMRWKKLAKHEQTCPHRPIESRKISQKFVQEHEQTQSNEESQSCQQISNQKTSWSKNAWKEYINRDFDIKSYLKLIRQCTDCIVHQAAETNHNIQASISEMATSLVDSDIIKTVLVEIAVDNNSTKTAIKETYMMIVKNTEKMFITERHMEQLARKSDVESQHRDIRGLKETYEQLLENILRLERDGVKCRVTSQPMQDRYTENIKSQIIQCNRQLGIHDIKMAELELRYKILEAINYDGIMIWKISGYTRRKNEAITGRTLCLYSQPLYTAQYGYKLCAKVYLNGNASGEGTHLSMYIAIMRGDFDPLLHWPFLNPITVELIDQTRSGKSVIQTLNPNLTSASVRRPVTEMNSAYGFPQFISHSELETPTFIQDDTLFIKVNVVNNNYVE